VGDPTFGTACPFPIPRAISNQLPGDSIFDDEGAEACDSAEVGPRAELETLGVGLGALCRDVAHATKTTPKPANFHDEHVVVILWRKSHNNWYWVKPRLP